MNPRRRQQRIYRKAGRWYGDFRDFKDVGGGQEALKPLESSYATTEQHEAELLAARRLDELRELRRKQRLYGIHHRAAIQTFAAHHMIEKARSPRNYSETYLSDLEYRLTAAAERFGAGTNLAEIGPRQISEWAAELGNTRSPQTVLHYLNAFSNLYRRALAEGVVSGPNPVQAMIDKPAMGRQEADFFEVDEAAKILEAARTLTKSDRVRVPIYPILGTWLLAGARKDEGLGLITPDLNFERATLRIWTNAYRGLKTDASHRIVPLWPQLAEILRGYLASLTEVEIDGLLFQSRRGGMIQDVRKALAIVAVRAGIAKARLRPHTCRHTYCAARIQTLDQGAPVAESTVVKEMGHESPELVRRIYSHLGTIRQRSEVVEYRVTIPVTNAADSRGQGASA